jgi:aminoglycoside phosphotransferase (APT) family kinase protein
MDTADMRPRIVSRHGEIEPCEREPKPRWENVPRSVVSKVEDLVKSKVSAAETVWGGFSPSANFKLQFANDQIYFAKGCHPDQTAAGKRAFESEVKTYRELGFLQNYAPRNYGTVEEEDWSFLLMEYVSGANRVLPWNKEKMTRVLERIADYQKVSQGYEGKIAAVEGCIMADFFEPNDWREILENEARDLENFYEQPAAARRWFDEYGPDLIRREEAIKTLPVVDDYKAIVHFDLRSDNIVIKNDEPLFVDWSYPVWASALIDLAGFVPSAIGEGGPFKAREMVEIYEKCLGYKFDRDHWMTLAVRMASFFGCRASQPTIPALPRLRWVQRLQFFPALEWAAEMVGLPRPPEPKKIW